MVARRCLLAVSAGACVLFSASAALANAISPVAGFWPGYFVLSPLLGIPATLLAAFVERPFLTLAGMRRRVLVHSIRANLWSWFVGAVLVLVMFALESALMFGFHFLAAIPLSIWIEGRYLRAVAARDRGSANWIAIIFGNLVSSLALILISAIAEDVGMNNPVLAWRLRPYQESLTVALGALSLAIVTYGLWPRRAEARLAESTKERLSPLDRQDAAAELS